MRTLARLLLVGALLACSACATLDTSVERTPSTAIPASPDTELAWRWQPQLDAAPGLSGFHLLEQGTDAFVARAALTGDAQRTLDLQYYMIQPDVTGRLLAGAVVRAADRGVRVRILLDDMYASEAEREVAWLDSHPGIEIRIFNPTRLRSRAGRFAEFLIRIGELNHRMHNKLYIVDGVAVILGGRNLGDEYFERNEQLDFRDLDVLGIGPIAAEAATNFDRYWNSVWSVPAAALPASDSLGSLDELRSRLEAHRQNALATPFLQALEDSPLRAQLAKGTLPLDFATARLLADEPGKVDSSHQKDDLLIEQLFAELPAADRQFLMSSPYFVPGKAGVRILGEMASRGVDVRVLTNSLAANDVPAVHGVYAKYRDDVLRAGIRLYELRRRTKERADEVRRRHFGSARASLHAKSFVIDGRHSFIGSMNVDPRSIEYNTEVGVLIDSPSLAGKLVTMFEYMTAPKRSYEVRLRNPGSPDSGALLWHGEEAGLPVIRRKDPQARWYKRFGVRVLGLIPGLESQL